jgi:hypothetical protein
LYFLIFKYMTYLETISKMHVSQEKLGPDEAAAETCWENRYRARHRTAND